MTIAAQALIRPRLAVRPIPRWLKAGGATWLATRLAIAGVFAGAYVLAGYWGRSVSLARWDTNWYTGIARDGYTTIQSANFFPLLPLLEAVIGRGLAGGRVPSQQQLLAAGLIVGAVATLVVFCALWALVELEADARTAGTAVRLLAAYPLALFLGVAYTDGPFLAAALLYFFAVRRGRWWAAAGAGLAAGLLRPVAPLLGLALLVELAFEVASRRMELATLKGRLLAVASPLLGTGAYAGYLWLRFGDPLLFMHTQARYWHHVLAWPWQTLGLMLQHLSQQKAGMTPLDLGLMIVFTGLAIGVIARMRPAYGVLTAGLLLMVLISPMPSEKDVIHSAGRYLLAAFPAFWMAARWLVGHPRLEIALLAVGFPLQAAFTVLFLLGGPVY